MATLRLEGLRQDVRRSHVTAKVVEHWDRFPGEVVQSLSFVLFKTELAKALAELI